MFEGKYKRRIRGRSRGRRRKKEALMMEIEKSENHVEPPEHIEYSPPPLVDLNDKFKSTEQAEEPSRNDDKFKSPEQAEGPSRNDDHQIFTGESLLSNTISFSTAGSSIVSEVNITASSALSEDTRDLSVLSPHQHPPSIQKQLESKLRVDLEEDDDEDSSYRDIEHITSSGTDGVFRDFSNWAEMEYSKSKQRLAVLSIAFSASQLTVLMLQLALCGVAPLDVNPTVGPYPDAFSDWQGKNAYLFVKELEIWRIITPAFLHIGVLHLLCNAAVQLETCAYFEREWGSLKWFIIYVLSEAGCIIVSCLISPDTVAVGSSGAIVGLFAAKFAQILAFASFDVEDEKDQYSLNSSQIIGMLCMFSVVALMSLFSYIEWEGHLGGLIAGFFSGFVLLCGPVKSAFARVFLFTFGLGVLCGGFYYATTWLFTEIEPDEELADSCTYFRTLFAEGYDCQCLWD